MTPVKPMVRVGTGTGTIPTKRAKDTRHAARALSEAFLWQASPEGHDFWRSIRNRLNDIANELERKAAQDTDAPDA